MTRLILPLSVLLLLSLACRFTASDSTPAPDSVPPTSAPADSAPLCREVLPSETDSAITQSNEPHIVCTPDQANQRGELFVFLPGTGATPDYYTQLMDAAAEAGMHVIALRYPNDRSANIQICPRDPDDDCHEKVRREITQGVDVSGNVTVDAANSVEGRLQSALTHLAEQAPAEGWEQFLDGDSIRWESVVISGHSQGGGHAAYIAYQHRVHHVVAFAWADVRKGELASWLVNTTSQTPADSWYLFWHEQDANVARYQPILMTALGMDAFGAPVVVDESDPPYGNTHALVATYPAPDGELAHNTHVVDFALNFDANGEPIYKAAWQYLLTLEAPTTATAFAPIRNSVKMGNSPLGYIDPEFYSALNLATFADADMNAWLAALDPQTGGFVSPDGRDIFIDRDLTPLRVSFNAPEFGVDKNGWALYYTKDVNNVPQVFRATVSGESVTTENLTDDDITRLSVNATRNPLLENTRLLYAYGGFSPNEGSIGWLDESAPQTSETIAAPIDRGARWIDGTTSFAFVRDGQAAIYDTETKTAQTVTATSGEKTYAYGWLVPETGGLLILTIVDDSRLEIYADNGSPTWDLIDTLTIPAESAYGVIGSPEAFTADGKSYITLVVKENTNYAPAEVWVWGIESENRFTLHCDDGQGKLTRTDPETYIGTNQVFVYYNTIGNGQRFELFRCETGLKP
ncbi:MAG: BPSS1187 family protein [Chloroflexota bacterium]